MVWFVILAVITAGLAVGLTPDPKAVAQLHTTDTAYRLAILAVLIPYGVIWFCAFFAFAKLKEYYHATKGYKDGEAFKKVMIGSGVLAFGLILPTMISLILRHIAVSHPGFHNASVIISNYLTLLVVLVTFLFFGDGTRMLTSVVKTRPGLAGLRLFMLLFICIAVAFTYLVITNAKRHDIYFLNTPLLIFTFIIPYLFAWYMGLFSSYEFVIYARHSKGLLYKRALNQFGYGIIIFIAGFIAAEFLDNTVIASKAMSSLGRALIIDYIILIVIAIGLILMALGAKKLKRFEEV